MTEIDYAAEIRAIRGYLNLSGVEMAKRLNIHPNTLRNYEQGLTVPSVKIWGEINRMKAESQGAA